jgi:uncharacterized surface protein with fasciclin (FAS1) repeats
MRRPLHIPSLPRVQSLFAAALIALLCLVQSPFVVAADLMDTMIGMPSFCAFLGAVRAAGLEQELRGPGPFTLLAPTDEAFALVPAQVRASLMRTDNREALAAVIRRHLLPGRITAHGLAGQRRWAQTAAGVWLLVDGTSGQLMVDDGIEVLYADIVADNGVLHIVDSVVLPN